MDMVFVASIFSVIAYALPAWEQLPERLDVFLKRTRKFGFAINITQQPNYLSSL